MLCGATGDLGLADEAILFTALRMATDESGRHRAPHRIHASGYVTMRRCEIAVAGFKSCLSNHLTGSQDVCPRLGCSCTDAAVLLNLSPRLGLTAR